MDNVKEIITKEMVAYTVSLFRGIADEMDRRGVPALSADELRVIAQNMELSHLDTKEKDA